jgi:hypothetical protein
MPWLRPNATTKCKSSCGKTRLVQLLIPRTGDPPINALLVALLLLLNLSLEPRAQFPSLTAQISPGCSPCTRLLLEQFHETLGCAEPEQRYCQPLA